MYTLSDLPYSKLGTDLSKLLNDAEPKLRENLKNLPSISEGLVQILSEDDPISCQQSQRPSPRMWRTEGWATDVLDASDLDIGILRHIVEAQNPASLDLDAFYDIVLQVADARAYLLGSAVLSQVTRRQSENRAAISREVFPHQTAMPNGINFGFSAEFRPILAKHQLEFSIRYTGLYYPWGYWTQVGQDGRESGLAPPPEQEAVSWRLPEGPSTRLRR